MTITFLGLAASAAQQGAEAAFIRYRNAAASQIHPQTPIAAVGLPQNRGIFPTSPASQSIVANVVIEETHNDNLEITQHPIELGSAISDHVFRRPAELTLYMGWADNKHNNYVLPQLRDSSASQLLEQDLISIAATLATSSIPILGGIYGAGLANAFNFKLDGLLSNTEYANINKEINGLLTVVPQSTLNNTYHALLSLQENRTLFDVVTGRRTYRNMVCRNLTVETTYQTAYVLLVKMICQEIIMSKTNVVSATSLLNTAQPQVNQPVVNSGNSGLNLANTSNSMAAAKAAAKARVEALPK